MNQQAFDTMAQRKSSGGKKGKKRASVGGGVGSRRLSGGGAGAREEGKANKKRKVTTQVWESFFSPKKHTKVRN